MFIFINKNLHLRAKGGRVCAKRSWVRVLFVEEYEGLLGKGWED